MSFATTFVIELKLQDQFQGLKSTKNGPQYPQAIHSTTIQLCFSLFDGLPKASPVDTRLGTSRGDIFCLKNVSVVILEQPFSPLVSHLSIKNCPENKLYQLLQQMYHYYCKYTSGHLLYIQNNFYYWSQALRWILRPQIGDKSQFYYLTLIRPGFQVNPKTGGG